MKTYARCPNCQREYHTNGCGYPECTMSIVSGTWYSIHYTDHLSAGKTFSTFWGEVTISTESDPLYRQQLGNYNHYEAPAATCPACYHRGYVIYAVSDRVDTAIELYNKLYEHVSYINFYCNNVLNYFELPHTLSTMIEEELDKITYHTLWSLYTKYVPHENKLYAYVLYERDKNRNLGDFTVSVEI